MKHLKTIDINCDLGEGESMSDCDNDALLMPYISRCNIACGGHAGNQITMHQSLVNAAKNKLIIGAHPGYPDPQNFGRLSVAITWSELQASLKQQIDQLNLLAIDLKIKLDHIKFHGALYNDIEADETLASSIASFCFQNYPSLKILGLANGKLAPVCKQLGIRFIAEGFMDRSYRSNGNLTPRTQKDALLSEPNKVIEQAVSLATRGFIDTNDKQTIRLIVDSICLHGDNVNALKIAKTLHQTLTKFGFEINPINKKHNHLNKTSAYSIVDNGDTAFTIIFNEIISETLTRKIVHLAKIIQLKMSQSFSEIIPAYQSLTLCYSPVTIAEDSLKKKLTQLLKDEYLDFNLTINVNHAKLIKIPVCYAKEFAPDLNYVAEHCGITEAEVIVLHSKPEYLVHMLGFLPGFLYMGGLNQQLFCPRKPTPRKIIHAGSVAIGGNQTGIYPVNSPGGWQIIGRSPISLFNPENDYPAIASPLDRIKFVAISKLQFEQLENKSKTKEKPDEVY